MKRRLKTSTCQAFSRIFDRPDYTKLGPFTETRAAKHSGGTAASRAKSLASSWPRSRLVA